MMIDRNTQDMVSTVGIVLTTPAKWDEYLEDKCNSTTEE